MGLLDNTSHQLYYQGNDYGNYQFTSLEDIINQFLVAYVGEEKIISKASRTDVAFHAQRAMQELSFDTFKSIKSQEITLPPSNTMILPHDYVNYTKLSWSDSAGIKHPLYPTKHTSNPFDIEQDSDGNYVFPTSSNLGVNMDFEDPLIAPWQANTPMVDHYTYVNGSNGADGYNYMVDEISIVSGALTFKQYIRQAWAYNKSLFYCAWQELDVSTMNTITLSATGTAEGSSTNITGGTITIGISSIAPDPNTFPYGVNGLSPNIDAFNADSGTNSLLATYTGGPAQLKWINGETSVNKELVGTNDEIDVSNHSTVYLVITSEGDFTTSLSSAQTIFENTFTTNSIDDINITSPTSSLPLSTNATQTSTTWDNYKSATPSENQDDYQDDTYWPNNQKRYGLEPQHAQVNGSFYINNLRGLINFSSNVSGKTVILDYISDSLGTDGEMQVHKFAEEAMYKWIMYAILSTRANTQEYIVQRYKKEKFAATRQAKLRLSNIKLEELTQILRGKSKHIKH